MSSKIVEGFSDGGQEHVPRFQRPPCNLITKKIAININEVTKSTKTLLLYINI
jgi:hypothetical protein